MVQRKIFLIAHLKIVLASAEVLPGPCYSTVHYPGRLRRGANTNFHGGAVDVLYCTVRCSDQGYGLMLFPSALLRKPLLQSTQVERPVVSTEQFYSYRATRSLHLLREDLHAQLSRLTYITVTKKGVENKYHGHHHNHHHHHHHHEAAEVLCCWLQQPLQPATGVWAKIDCLNATCSLFTQKHATSFRSSL